MRSMTERALCFCVPALSFPHPGRSSNPTTPPSPGLYHPPMSAHPKKHTHRPHRDKDAHPEHTSIQSRNTIRTAAAGVLVFALLLTVLGLVYVFWIL